MTRAITFGAFDLLHYGHLRLLQRIAEMAGYVAVGLATDDIVTAGGKDRPFYPFPIRREMLLHTRYVDDVFEHGGPVDGTGRVRVIAGKIRLIEEHKIDLVVMGGDWTGEYDFLRAHCRVVYLERTPDISTTAIVRMLRAN